MLTYLDDFLIEAELNEKCLRHILIVRDDVHEVVLSAVVGRSVVIPKQNFTWFRVN